MPNIVEAFVSAIILLVGLMVVAVLLGADPTVATDVFTEIVEIGVVLFLIGIFATIILRLVGGV